MNIIYADILFFVNFICDYILLVCTARISGAVIHRIPIVFAALLGGLYACLSMLPYAEWLQHPIVKWAWGILLCLISFGSEQGLFRSSIIFLLVSAIVGGVLAAISIPYNGTPYLPLHIKTVVPIFLLLYSILSKLFQNSPQRITEEYRQVTVTLIGRSITFQALRDTGNDLYDPITNRPVIVCSPTLLQELFSTNLPRDADAYELIEHLSTQEGLQSRLRLIPCRTVTGCGVLPGFKPDSVYIDHTAQPHIIAISNTALPASSPYQAIY